MFFGLMGEVQAGDRYDSKDAAHREWLGKRISKRFSGFAPVAVLPGVYGRAAKGRIYLRKLLDE